MSPGPRIHLAIDNCFASKRWVEPEDWAREIADLGLRLVEASADTENDPCYQPAEAFLDWPERVRAAESAHGVRVINLYSGHGSYATCGLGHRDPRIRAHLRDRWLTPMLEQAARLGAGLGFFCHAFDQAVLQDPARYRQAVDDLVEDLAILAQRAQRLGVIAGVEQMYSPHQVPWTIEGARELLRRVHARSGAAWYLTLDVGHQSGQHRFRSPGRSELEQAVAAARAGAAGPAIWVGSDHAHGLLTEAAAADPRRAGELIDRILADCARRPQLFAAVIDSDPYAWIEALAPWSPIIHLQQTDGTSSRHWPFTAECNARGIIERERLLEAISRSYARIDGHEMPPPVTDIFLTIEVFSATADTPAEIRSRLRETVAYWRNIVPRDGIPLDSLIASGSRA